MKKNMTGIVVGLILIAVGALVVAEILFDFDFSIWRLWPLFIVVPCFIGMINHPYERRSYITGLVVGLALLVCTLCGLNFGEIIGIGVAAAIIAVGVQLILGKDKIGTKNDNVNNGNYSNGNYSNGNYNNGNYNNCNNASYTNAAGNTGNAGQTFTDANYDSNTGKYSDSTANNQGNNANNGDNTNFNNGRAYRTDNQGNVCACSAVLGSRTIKYDNEVFRGAVLSAFLGAIELDLRRAYINDTVVVEAKSFLGGIDIWVPNYARVIVNGTPVLGSIENNAITPPMSNEHTPTIVINISCVLGGVEIT